MSLAFILKAAGSSEVGRDRITLVFIEDQPGWAPGEDILEQNKWKTWRETRTERQRDRVYVSRSLRVGNDVISPLYSAEGLFTPAVHLQAPCLTCLQEVGGNMEERWRISQGHSEQGNAASSLHGTQGLAQSNGVGGEEEDRIGAKYWVPGFSGSCSCPLRDSEWTVVFKAREVLHGGRKSENTLGPRKSCA